MRVVSTAFATLVIPDFFVYLPGILFDTAPGIMDHVKLLRAGLMVRTSFALRAWTLCGQGITLVSTAQWSDTRK